MDSGRSAIATIPCVQKPVATPVLFSMDDQVLIHILETACADDRIIFQVVEQERHLHIFINRDTQEQLDYKQIGKKIYQAFRRLTLTDIDGVCLYSRRLGEEEPDWEARFRLPQAQTVQQFPSVQPTVQPAGHAVDTADTDTAETGVQHQDQAQQSEQRSRTARGQAVPRQPVAVQTGAPAAAAAYPLSDSDGAAAAAEAYEAAEPTVSVMADIPVAEPGQAVLDPVILEQANSAQAGAKQAEAEQAGSKQVAEEPSSDFDLSSYCFIRNRLLLTADLVPPSKAVAQQVISFHGFSTAEKQQLMPLLERSLKGAATIATEGLPEAIQQWFATAKAFSGEDNRKYPIWLSRYCVEPDVTLGVMERVLDPGLAKSTQETEPETSDATESEARQSSGAQRATDEAGSRARSGAVGAGSVTGKAVGDRPASPSQQRSATHRPQGSSSVTSSAQTSSASVPAWLFPGLVSLGSIVLILLGLIVARPPAVAADFCAGSASPEYCQLATQLVDSETLTEISEYSTALPAEARDRQRSLDLAAAACNPFAAMNAGQNILEAFDDAATPVKYRTTEILPGVLIADLEHPNLDENSSGKVRTVCLLSNETVEDAPTAWSEPVHIDDVVIPNAWPAEPFENSEARAAQMGLARATNPLVRVGATMLFTAIGLFAAVMMRLAIAAHTVDALCQATIVMCIIESILDFIVPFGILSTVAAKSLALGATSGIVRDFHVDWTGGYLQVAVGVMVMAVVRLVLYWIFFVSILQGGMPA